jgi:curved DNA-binding protein CbpA
VLSQAKERETQRTLSLQLIDIGYKVLATKLHPDKGGSPEAMARLNQVRDALKRHV